MNDLISRKALIAEYDRVHVGPPGGARKLMEDAPAVDEPHWATEQAYKNGYEQGKKDALKQCAVTREKLIELIEQGRDKGNEMCGKQYGCDKCQYKAPKACVWGFIADHLIANGVTLDNQVSSSKWIPVSERLPLESAYREGG